MHHSQPELYRIAGSVDLTLLAVDQNLALIGRVEAVEDVHYGGLAGAVFADDCVDGSVGNGEADVIVGQHFAKTLADSAHFDCVSRVTHIVSRLRSQLENQSACVSSANGGGVMIVDWRRDAK